MILRLHDQRDFNLHRTGSSCDNRGSTRSHPTVEIMPMSLSLVFLLAWVQDPAAQAQQYQRDVKPLLATRCYACHGALKSESGLRLDTVAAMLAGGDGGPVVYAKVREVLLSLTNDCEPAPARLTTNDFPLSGSVARRSVGSFTVDATINPITINGVLVDAVSAANFRVIENGCAKSVTLSRGSGGAAVKVDLVFLQDLSTSMGNAISGVKASVFEPPMPTPPSRNSLM